MKTSIVLGIALALCAGCSSDNGSTAASTSGVGSSGESCQARADCASGLLCVQNVCTAQITPPEAGPLGKRGESCRSRADCETGLACVNSQCAVATYNLTTTGKTCKSIDCTTAADCCPAPSASCEMYAGYCEGGMPTYCTLYQTSCVCDASKYTCDQNQCIQACTGDAGIGLSSCPYDLPVCSNGRCVRCAKDTDCSATFGSASVCVNNECQKRCTGDFECAPLYACQSSTCVKVGCSSTRECIFANDDPLSVCTDKKTCIVPCQVDAECNRTGAVSVAVCVNGQCADIGCETENDCRAMNSRTMPNTRWLCQPATP